MNKKGFDRESALALFRKACHEHGLRITPQRTAVYTRLAQAEDHPNAESLHRRIMEQFPNISLDTVNRTLLTLTRIGLASVVEGGGDPKRFDPDIELHHHARCVECGKILDFYHEEYDNLGVPREIREKMNVIGKRVVIEGLCNGCRKVR